MSNPWDHLPNAKYIDAILASVKACPTAWMSASSSIKDTIRQEVWRSAQEASRTADRDLIVYASWNVVLNPMSAARWAARDKTSGPPRSAARLATRALIAWDDCAYILDSDLAEVEILARLGDHKAILLLPACKALNNIKESLTCNPI